MKRRGALAMLMTLMAMPLAAQSGWQGRWEGSMTMVEGTLSFGLTVTQDGALLDMPAQNLYGYPSASALQEADGISLSWNFGGGQLLLQARPSAAGATGRFGQGEASGPFMMVRSSFQPDPALQLSLAMKDGAKLAGTLALPSPVNGKPPLLILHAGLGAADRDGNNYNVPGRNDALKQLAQSLAGLGVATYRYDKRGSGQSTWLVRGERELSFEAWILDLATIVDHFSGDSRFSGVWILGLNDGALVAAAAAGRSAARGLVIACASASGPLDSFRKAVADAPQEFRAEGQAILEALVAGRTVENPSDFYAAAFRPGFQPYLIEAFRHDLEAELGAYRGRVMIAQGDMDLQVTLEDFAALGGVAPDAVAVIVPRMNHVLKDVPQDVEENFAAFSDPSYPVSQAFAEAVREFIEGR